MFDILEAILLKSEIAALFTVRLREDNTDKENPHVAYRVKSNLYQIRRFELWGSKEEYFFRIYHSKQINDRLKERLVSVTGNIRSFKKVVDYINLAIRLKNILINNEVIDECKKNSTLAMVHTMDFS